MHIIICDYCRETGIVLITNNYIIAGSRVQSSRHGQICLTILSNDWCAVGVVSIHKHP
jgi:hypothetical protein